MQAVNYSHARNNLKSIIDDVCDNNEAYIITTKHGKNVMVLSLEEYTRQKDSLKQDTITALKLLHTDKEIPEYHAVKRAKLAYGLE